LDPGHHGADAFISYITQAITASNQLAHCGRALNPPVLHGWTSKMLSRRGGA
jgi:hypothetical protein